MFEGATVLCDQPKLCAERRDESKTLLFHSSLTGHPSRLTSHQTFQKVTCALGTLSSYALLQCTFSAEGVVTLQRTIANYQLEPTLISELLI